MVSRLTVNQVLIDIAGSSPALPTIYSRLVQLVESLTVNEVVTSSSLVSGAYNSGCAFA